MGQCPGKRNVDWNGGGMGEQQHYDRPTPHVVATSAPQFEDGEQGVDNSDCRHHRRPGFRPRIDGADRAGDYPEQDPYQCQGGSVGKNEMNTRCQSRTLRSHLLNSCLIRSRLCRPEMSATIVVKMRGMQARRSLEQRERYRHDFLAAEGFAPPLRQGRVHGAPAWRICQDDGRVQRCGPPDRRLPNRYLRAQDSLTKRVQTSSRTIFKGTT